MDDFETQMDKGVLLGKLHRQLEVLRMERAKARGEYQRAITAYRKKLAVSIRAGLKRLESGKIDVTSCQYDLLHELIKQAGDQPDDTRTLDKLDRRLRGRYLPDHQQPI